ncbi:MAG: 5-(carboxyamino)imidazole ribonucleotide mutase [Planctomycetota bacterium]|jgi:5-(carboxyamino)imidazole ribonucleotide mutase
MSEPYTTVPGARVGVLMGSPSDWPTMRKASETLEGLGIAHECNALSAHRNPEQVVRYCTTADERGLRVLICAAGGAAHLAGVVAAHTHLPVLGCPMQAWSLDGLDSLLSTVQMPKGIPVATFAIGGAGAVNAALFAAAILALEDEAVRQRLLAFRREQSESVRELPTS